MPKYVSPLRDLAQKVDEVASSHFTYSQVLGLFQHVNEHLLARAYIEEMHQREHQKDE